MKQHGQTQKRFLLAALLFTVLALGLHGYLTVQYYDLKLAQSAEPSLCNINETFNCDVVSASAYSQFMGIPMALWGFLTNLVFLFFLAVYSFNLTEQRARVGRITFSFSLFIFITSIVMGTISFTLIGALCIFCMGAYALSLLSLISLFIGLEEKKILLFEDLKSFATESKWIGIFILCIPIGAFMGHRIILDSYGFARLDDMVKNTIAYWKTSNPQSFAPENGLTYSKSTSPPVMTIVEFADMLCPHCKHAAPTLHAFAASHPDVQLIFKSFPLDGTCNKNIRPGDGLRCRLAKAIYCGKKVSKGWEVHDWIFERQRDWYQGDREKLFTEMTTQLEIDHEKLMTCVASDDADAAIRAQANEGIEAQIQGTPAIFVNNRLLERGQSLPVLEAAYREIKEGM